MLNDEQFDPRSQDLLARDNHDPNSYSPNPHFRNADRGQGRLFAEQQYPRGYGPQRNAAVEEALPTPSYNRRTGPLDNGRLRQVHDELKATTIPAAHLDMVKNDYRTGRPGMGGSYNTNDQAKHINAQEFKSKDGEVGYVAAHETGHNVAHAILGPNAVDYATSGPGLSEGLADAYAKTHTPKGKDWGAHLGYNVRQIAQQANKVTAAGYPQDPASNAALYVHTMHEMGAAPHASWSDIADKYAAHKEWEKTLGHGRQLQLDLS